MKFGVFTKELDHLIYIPVIKRMYKTNSIEEIKAYAGFSQIQRFKNEIDTLQRFGLHKELEVKLPSSKEEPSGLKCTDGKADVIYSASNASIKETYRDEKNRKCFRRKIRHAFVESIVYKSNQTGTDDRKEPPLCFNCAAQLEVEGENYFCPSCRTSYQAEAYRYLLTRFFIEGAFSKLYYVLFVLVPAFILAMLQAKGKISQAQTEIISSIVGVVFSFLIIFALIRSLILYFAHREVVNNIKQHDPHFSIEIFTMRLIDLLTQQPEILLLINSSGKSFDKNQTGVICKNFRHLEFRTYRRENDLEIIGCSGKVDAIFLNRIDRHVHIKEKHEKATIYLARKHGVLTPIHYVPDQFTCPNCSGHQTFCQVGNQVCNFCHSSIPISDIDWMLYPNN